MAGIIVGAKILGIKLLEAKLQGAFKEWAKEDVNGDYWDKQFGSKIWDYPGTTIRKNTETIAPGKRDIYDLGKLYESGIESFKTTNSDNSVTASWDWDAKNSTGSLYAYYVHEGAEKAGNNLVPRKWTDALVVPSLFAKSDLSELLKKRITIALSR
jgi:hypothetical protein